MVVVKVVDEDVSQKVDTQYVREHLPDMENLAIIFICTKDGVEEDEWIDDETGVRQLVIQLPYQVVKESKDVRALMLERAKERLGLMSGSSMN